METRALRSAPVRLTVGVLRRAAKALAYALGGAFVVLLAVGIRYLESRPDLRVWHQVNLDTEFTARSELASLAEYLALEDRLFEQLAGELELLPADRTQLNRYHEGSLADPGRWPVAWNRSFEWVPESPDWPDSPVASVLLLHGMSDSPYSLRHLAEALHARGARVLGLRLPGHGTAPSGLVTVHWRDMAAAVTLGLRHLRERAAGGPVYVIGYSNGGALAVVHAIAALEDPSLPQVDGMVLISPSIGVTKLAVFAVWQARLGVLLGLPKLAWSSILPEFDPFKYGSFAMNAGDQVFRLTAEIGAGLDRLEADGRIQDFPPVLAFQSLTDATVSTRAVLDRLFLRLPGEGHTLVFFDLNRFAASEGMLRADPREAIQAELAGRTLSFDFDLITNENGTSSRVVLRHKRAGQTEVEVEPLGLAWPRGLYSLAHISLPFPEGDSLYGGPGASESPGIALGWQELRGERGVLVVSAADLMRLRWNPFYRVIEERVLASFGLD